MSSAPCPIAHCNQHLDGQEGVNTGTTLSFPVSTPPSSETIYTPTAPIAFNKGLACTAGMPAAGSYPNALSCTGTVAGTPTNTATPCTGACGPPPPTSTPVPGPFIYTLSASGSGSSTSLSTTWTSAAYTGPPSLPCTAGTSFPVDSNVVQGAPLFNDVGRTYVSDDQSMVTYTAAGSGGTGTCVWGQTNPAGAAMISWNAVDLPQNGTYGGGWWLVGQGTSGPVLVVDFQTGQYTASLSLPDGGGGSYVTYNTISAVQVKDASGTLLGARLYDSTEDCPTSGPCGALAHVPGRLYAIDVLPPSTSGGVPTLHQAWTYPFEGPSGASPMVMPAGDVGERAPVGDQIYFDGSGASCGTSCTTEAPTLFAVQDACTFDSACSTPSLVFSAINFTTTFGSTENGYCSDGHGHSIYDGMQSAPVLEIPEVSGGSDSHYSVWEHVACGPNLYRFDAQTGAQWGGNGASTIDVGDITLNGQSGYVPGSTMQTVTNADLSASGAHDQVAFLGINQVPATKQSYVIALDLEQTALSGQLLWSKEGPEPLQGVDSPFHGQFPIVQTGASSYALIAATAGSQDGANILAIPLS